MTEKKLNMQNMYIFPVISWQIQIFNEKFNSFVRYGWGQNFFFLILFDFEQHNFKQFWFEKFYVHKTPFSILTDFLWFFTFKTYFCK